MRLTCHLREIRGERPLTAIAKASGVAVGSLSQIERGLMLPLDKHVEPLEQAYGVPAERWYSRLALRAIQEGDTHE